MIEDKNSYPFTVAIKSTLNPGDIMYFQKKYKKLNKKILVHKSKIRTRPSNSEVDRLLSSNTKAKKILKWKPVFSGLKGFEKGLKKTIEWFENEKIYKIYKSNRYNI